MKILGRKRNDLPDRRVATPGQIAVRVRELRKAKGKTLDDCVAACKGIVSRRPAPHRERYCGVTRSYLMKLEKGLVVDLRPFSYETRGPGGEPVMQHGGLPVVVGRLAYLFDVTPEEILKA